MTSSQDCKSFFAIKRIWLWKQLVIWSWFSFFTAFILGRGKCEYYKLLRLLALMTWSIRGGAKEAVNYGQSWFSVAHDYYEISIIVVGIVIMIMALTMIETKLSSRSPSWWSSPGSRSLPHLISVVRGVEILQGVVRLTWCDQSLARHCLWLSRWWW